MPIEFDAAPHMRPWRRRPSALALATASCCALLVACQHTPPPEPKPKPAVSESPAQTPAEVPASAPELVPVRDALPVETTEEALARLLRYSERLRAMSVYDRKQDLSAQSSQVPKSGSGPTPGTGPSPKAQMQLALALLQTREPVETARALGLLQRVAASTEPEARAYTALAHVLIDNLINTRRLEDNLERTSQQLRESQRRIEVLNDRLDAMRAIERSLNAQPPSQPRPMNP